MWDFSSTTRDWTCIPVIARQILNYWTTREVPKITFFKKIIWILHTSKNFIIWTLVSEKKKKSNVQIWGSYSSSAPVPLIDPSYLCLKKPGPCGWRGRKMAQRKRLPASTNMKLCLTVGRTRPGWGGSLPEDHPWAQGALGPRAPSNLQVSHSHLLGSPVSSVNDLRSVSQLLSQCWGPRPAPLVRDWGNGRQGTEIRVTWAWYVLWVS